MELTSAKVPDLWSNPFLYKLINLKSIPDCKINDPDNPFQEASLFKSLFALTEALISYLLELVLEIRCLVESWYKDPLAGKEKLSLFFINCIFLLKKFWHTELSKPLFSSLK